MSIHICLEYNAITVVKRREIHKTKTKNKLHVHVLDYVHALTTELVNKLNNKFSRIECISPSARVEDDRIEVVQFRELKGVEQNFFEASVVRNDTNGSEGAISVVDELRTNVTRDAVNRGT